MTVKVTKNDMKYLTYISYNSMSFKHSESSSDRWSGAMIQASVCIDLNDVKWDCCWQAFVFLQVIAKGLVLGKNTYLRTGWNVMDGFLVVISLIDIVISFIADSSPRIFGILRVFRLLRTLRPLRLVRIRVLMGLFIDDEYLEYITVSSQGLLQNVKWIQISILNDL